MIDVSPFQPRKAMEPGAIERLADSIRRSGMMQPVILRRRSGGGVVQYELVAGERRWRAAQMAGLTEIPALVRELTDEIAAEWALVENVQREDLNAMERGWALRALAERFNLTQAELAQRVGLERSTVANLIRLTELEQEIAQMIVRGDLTAGHGRALLAIPAGEARLNLAREAVQNGWNTRRVEYLAQAHSVKPENVGSKRVTPQEITARQAVLRDLERQIGQHLGTKVLITTDRTGAKGKLTVEFYSIDHFDGLLARLGVSTR
ncbi:MAG: ParB/RepB/Spo0J family partition protein [Planctomycetes bacterium]|nr:ParB/RepB/Spo0J family partition protein [Planctomycetota bacterium]